ncbi:Fic family protein [bacterium]|nr:Fic family protein [bacterium]
MLSLRPENLIDGSIPVGTAWLLAACMEARGKQDLRARQMPEDLKALREQAIIQSAESSNRIEGVTVAPDRLRPIVLGQSRPRDRSEEEVVGYRRALNWIFNRKQPIRVEPRTILHLHKLAQGGLSGDAGKWKTRDNEIVEILSTGERSIRFKPTPAKQTPKAIDRLCAAHRDLADADQAPVLLVAATFVFDFLCVHPFRDGNGRVSRLLTTLLLQNAGFTVARYVSLERMVEETKEDYYRILKECSVGWHAGANDLLPWWNYFLSTLRSAYTEFEHKVEASTAHGGKSDLVRHAIENQPGPFALAEIRAQCPSVSLQLIKKVLMQMKSNGEVTLTGRGRSARWVVL